MLKTCLASMFDLRITCLPLLNPNLSSTFSASSSSEPPLTRTKSSSPGFLILFSPVFPSRSSSSRKSKAEEADESSPFASNPKSLFPSSLNPSSRRFGTALTQAVEFNASVTSLNNRNPPFLWNTRCELQKLLSFAWFLGVQSRGVNPNLWILTVEFSRRDEGAQSHIGKRWIGTSSKMIPAFF